MIEVWIEVSSAMSAVSRGMEVLVTIGHIYRVEYLSTLRRSEARMSVNVGPGENTEWVGSEYVGGYDGQDRRR